MCAQTQTPSRLRPPSFLFHLSSRSWISCCCSVSVRATAQTSAVCVHSQTHTHTCRGGSVSVHVCACAVDSLPSGRGKTMDGWKSNKSWCLAVEKQTLKPNNLIDESVKGVTDVNSCSLAPNSGNKVSLLCSSTCSPLWEECWKPQGAAGVVWKGHTHTKTNGGGTLLLLHSLLSTHKVLICKKNKRCTDLLQTTHYPLLCTFNDFILTTCSVIGL